MIVFQAHGSLLSAGQGGGVGDRLGVAAVGRDQADIDGQRGDGQQTDQSHGQENNNLTRFLFVFHILTLHAR